MTLQSVNILRALLAATTGALLINTYLLYLLFYNTHLEYKGSGMKLVSYIKWGLPRAVFCDNALYSLTEITLLVASVFLYLICM